MSKFRYFKGNTFNEVFFPVFILDYLLGKASALSLYFAFDQFLQFSLGGLARIKLKEIDKIDTAKINKQDFDQRVFINQNMEKVW